MERFLQKSTTESSALWVSAVVSCHAIHASSGNNLFNNFTIVCVHKISVCTSIVIALILRWLIRRQSFMFMCSICFSWTNKNWKRPPVFPTTCFIMNSLSKVWGHIADTQLSMSQVPFLAPETGNPQAFHCFLESVQKYSLILPKYRPRLFCYASLKTHLIPHVQFKKRHQRN